MSLISLLPTKKTLLGEKVINSESIYSSSANNPETHWSSKLNSRENAEVCKEVYCFPPEVVKNSPLLTEISLLAIGNEIDNTISVHNDSKMPISGSEDEKSAQKEANGRAKQTSEKQKNEKIDFRGTKNQVRSTDLTPHPIKNTEMNLTKTSECKNSENKIFGMENFTNKKITRS
ncbi:hypothetical protein JTB14_018769 [Gonioctena quinquepunctata]|nr:hypothetical protein JTB14_018769 [Gonioctena quinquepunctata]